MKISIYLNRINLLHKLLSQEKTGVPEQLAKRLGLSESRLYSVLEELKLHNVPIEYNRKKKTYCYSRPFRMNATLTLEKLNDKELLSVTGVTTFFVE